MNVIVFGASGMVGQGAVRECLLDPDVKSVLIVVRSSTENEHPKLRELVHRDLFDFSAVEDRLSGYDACFFCIGVTSAGMSEPEYERVTYGLTMAAARTLARLNPGMTFIYVSGAGADSTERGRTMWARVRGKTENALLQLPFKATYVFRPGLIRPVHGVTSRTKAYRVFYTVFRPVLPLLDALFPKYVTTTERIGRAMLVAAKRGAAKRVLECEDINALAK